jgi:hypothetical protein
LHWHHATGFEAKDNVLEMVGDYSWRTVRVEEPIRLGNHYIEFDILETTENALLLGVVTKDFFEEGDNDYIHGLYGWGIYLPDGKKYNKKAFDPYMDLIPKTARNQRIGLILNMDNHTLAFAVNDKIMPVAFSDLPSEVYVAVSVIHVGDKIRINEVDSYKQFRMIHGLSL